MRIKVFKRIGRRGSKLVYSKFFRAVVEVGGASASAPLGPLLGQLQVPLLEFCTSFNDCSILFYNESVDLRVQLTKVETKYRYLIKYPRVSFFLCQFYLDYNLNLDDFIYTYYGVYKYDLWYLIQVCSAIWSVSVIQSARMIFGYFHTSIIRLIYLR